MLLIIRQISRRLGIVNPVNLPLDTVQILLQVHGHHVIDADVQGVREQAMATLKSWRLFRKPRCSTTRITDLVKAVLILHLATSV